MKNLSGLLAHQPLFQGLLQKYLDIIAQFAQEAEFEAGAILLKENQLASHFYLIQSGEVAIESRSESAGYFTVQTVKDGDNVGWSWMFAPYTNHFQARAVTATKAIQIDGARLLAHCENDRDLGYLLMKRIVPLLIDRLQSTRARVVELKATSL